MEDKRTLAELASQLNDLLNRILTLHEQL